jgi:MFS family permease
VIFFINVPVGLAAQFLIHKHMPDYRGETRRPLDVIGLVLFGSGTALLSWVLEIFGEHHIDATSASIIFLLSLCLLAAYIWHARQALYPLLNLSLFAVRTFRVSVVGGFLTRLGLGGLPFLLPLLYQLGLGLPAWQSGLLMMPTALAAMGMKLIAPRVLREFGYKKILIVNTLMIGITIALFSQVTSSTPIPLILMLGLSQGFFNSLQFSSMNSMAYADVRTEDSSMASTIASSLQQMSMSFGLACGSIVTAWYLGDLPQSDRAAVINALHHAFLTLGGLTILSSLSFWTLRANDGESVSKGIVPAPVEKQAAQAAVDPHT